MTIPTRSEQLRAGQGWARFGLGFGVALSITGNVAHTVLLDSPVSLWLRIPFATVWPVALFVAVEIFVRVRWNRSPLHWLGRLLLLGPVSAVAAIVSWLHLHHLMDMGGEPYAASILGPLAVDGLMIGSTVALLAIRALLADEPERTAPIAAKPKSWVVGPDGESVIEATVPDSPAELVSPVAPRTPRAPKEAQEKAVRLMLDGLGSVAVADGLVGASTMRRFQQVFKALRADSDTDDFGSATGKVPAALVAIIRDHVIEERA